MSSIKYTSAFLTSGSNVEDRGTAWATISDWEFAITIDGTAREITWIDFSWFTTIGQVVALLQTEIRAVTSWSETVEFDSDNWVMIIRSWDTSSSSAITVTSTVAAPSWTDISWAWASDWLDMDSWNWVASAAVVADNTAPWDDNYVRVSYAQDSTNQTRALPLQVNPVNWALLAEF